MERMTMFENSAGITVHDLKRLIKKWPETNDMGEPCKVWIETGRGLSSQAMRGCALDVRKYNGEYSADLLLESDAFEDEK